MYFSFLLFTLASCILVLWPFIFDIHCTLFSYIWWWCMFLHLSLHVLFILSLYTHASLCMQSLFRFHTWCLDKSCLKSFRKAGCESLLCHELFSYEVFQEFVLGLDLFYNSTGGYEFSDLRLLSRFICLLWFCHGLPKGEIVRDIYDVIG